MSKKRVLSDSELERRYPDYLEYDSHTGSAKYVSDYIVKGRRVCLYGLGVVFSQNGERLEMSPSIPALGPLCKLLHDRLEVTTCKWTGRKWVAQKSGTPGRDKP